MTKSDILLVANQDTARSEMEESMSHHGNGGRFRKGEERTREAAARGEYDLVEPLDYLILELMEPEGSMVSGLYPLGTTVISMNKKLKLSSPVISSRVRILHLMGLTKKVHSLGSGTGKKAWQRTPEADRLLKEWRESNGS